MKSYANIVVAFALAALPGSVGLRAEDAPLQTGEMRMEDVRLPLKSYPDGRVQVQLRAAEASMADAEGIVEASGVEVQMFTPEGEIESVVKADKAWYDRRKEHVTTDTAVQLSRDGMRISGRGLEWYASEERIRILSDVRVDFSYSMDAKRKRLKRDALKK